MDCFFNQSPADDSSILYQADILESPSKVLTFKDFKLKSLIAKGTYSDAKIHVAIHNKSKNYYAIRILDLDKEDELRFIFKELITQRSIRHYNLLKIVAVIQEESKLYCVHPLMEYGSCADILKKHFISGFPEHFIVLIMREVLMALIYLHNQDLVHCCIKSSHILISGVGSVKLTGFTCVQTRRTQALKRSRLHTLPERFTNSLCWASPEFLAQSLEGYTELADIYSLGITVCELCNGIVPFSDMPPTQMHLLKYLGTRPKLLEGKPHVIIESDITNTVGSDDEIISENMEPDNPSKRIYSVRFKQFISFCLRSHTKRKSAIQMINLQLFKDLRRRKIEPEILKELIHYEKYPHKTVKIAPIKCDKNESKKLTSKYIECEQAKPTQSKPDARKDTPSVSSAVVTPIESATSVTPTPSSAAVPPRPAAVVHPRDSAVVTPRASIVVRPVVSSVVSPMASSLLRPIALATPPPPAPVVSATPVVMPKSPVKWDFSDSLIAPDPGPPPTSETTDRNHADTGRSNFYGSSHDTINIGRTL